MKDGERLGIVLVIAAAVVVVAALQAFTGALW